MWENLEEKIFSGKSDLAGKNLFNQIALELSDSVEKLIGKCCYSTMDL